VWALEQMLESSMVSKQVTNVTNDRGFQCFATQNSQADLCLFRSLEPFHDGWRWRGDAQRCHSPKVLLLHLINHARVGPESRRDVCDPARSQSSYRRPSPLDSGYRRRTHFLYPSTETTETNLRGGKTFQMIRARITGGNWNVVRFQRD
jgi:hypothetical protein